MAIQVRVPGFAPSVNGLHFVNSFPREPVVLVDLPPFGKVALGDASGGLCGGMVFTVRDVFETPGLTPLPDAAQPGPDTPLFKYLAARLVDSFDLPHAGFMKYYDWMITPDHDMGWPPFFVRRGIAWKTIVEEWNAHIRRDLDAGQLCALGLVTTASTNPGDLGHNHQVLAYGYDLDDNNHLTLLIYDPNTSTADADGVRISLSLGNPMQTTPISHNVGIGNPVRGFFEVPYTHHDPTQLEPPPPLRIGPPDVQSRGRVLNVAQLSLTIEPDRIVPALSTVITVHAVDTASGAPVSGAVQIAGAPVGKTNVPFVYTFFLGGSSLASGLVLAPGYLPAHIEFNV
jgi:hypothetical protein